jgi:phosphonate transport system permease protein
MRLRWPTRSGAPAWPLLAGGVSLAAALIATAPLVEVSPARLAGSTGKLLRFLAQLLVLPEWGSLGDLLGKLLETIEMTFLSSCLAAALALPLGLLAARGVSPHPAVFHAARSLLSLVRALPELVWALVFVSGVGLGPLAGVMALSLVTVGFLAKFFAEAMEVVDPRPLEAVAAHGAGWLQLRTFAILPQAAPDLLGSFLYVLDHNLRAAAVLGLVGAGGIGYELVMAVRLFDYGRLTVIVLGVYACVTALDRLSDRFRTRVILG